jgi:hypothetical protein
MNSNEEPKIYLLPNLMTAGKSLLRLCRRLANY